jgi:hypothetical protein
MLHVPVYIVSLHEKLQCWFECDVAKVQVIENRICEGADGLKVVLSSCVTGLQLMVAS